MCTRIIATAEHDHICEARPELLRYLTVILLSCRLQLLLNAEDQEEACSKLDNTEEDGADTRCQSPKIQAVKEFQLVELETVTNNEQAEVQ